MLNNCGVIVMGKLKSQFLFFITNWPSTRSLKPGCCSAVGGACIWIMYNIRCVQFFLHLFNQLCDISAKVLLSNISHFRRSPTRSPSPVRRSRSAERNGHQESPPRRRAPTRSRTRSRTRSPSRD